MIRLRSKARTGLMFVRALGLPQTLLYLIQRRRLRRGRAIRPLRLLSRLARYPLHCRPGSSDFGVFNQVFVQGQYRCFDELEKAGLIIDCGANVGYASAYFLTRFPQATLIAVEPDLDNFALLKANLAPYGKRSTALHAAIWSHSTALTLSKEPYRDGGAWTRQVRPALAGEQADVAAIDLETLCRRSGFERISILKVDIERAERVIFAANYEPWLARVDNLVIELHDEECRAVVMNALASRRHSLSERGEVLICRMDVA